MMMKKKKTSFFSFCILTLCIKKCELSWTVVNFDKLVNKEFFVVTCLLESIDDSVNWKFKIQLFDCYYYCRCGERPPLFLTIRDAHNTFIGIVEDAEESMIPPRIMSGLIKKLSVLNHLRNSVVLLYVSAPFRLRLLKMLNVAEFRLHVNFSAASKRRDFFFL